MNKIKSLWLLILLIPLYASETSWDRYIQDTGEIEHAVKPEAWKQFTVDDALKELYGKRKKIYDKDIVLGFTRKGVEVQATIAMKSIAILQKRSKRTSLVTYIIGNEKEIDLNIPVFTEVCASPSITVAIEDTNGSLHMSEKTYVYDGKCEDINEDLYNGRTVKYFNVKNIHQKKFKPNLKVKIQPKNNEMIIKLLLLDKPITYDKAYSDNINVEFVSEIFVEKKNETIVKIYLSQYNKAGYIRFKTNNLNHGDESALYLKNIHGQEYSQIIKVK